MLFSQRLADSAALVEGHLGALLDSLAEKGAPRRLVAAMRHATLGGGKRFRPFLVLECAGLFGVAPQAAVPAAAALECVHCYSLIHDDLPAMDNDDLRRGKPTVHKAFDEWTAILAGDALLTLAFEVLADPATDAEPQVRAELAAGLARASGAIGMVGGQCFDLEAEKLGIPSTPNRADVDRLQAMKTGALIRFACQAGAVLGRGSPEERRTLATYGEHLGRAFQVADDLLDVTGDSGTIGKAVGKDFGKATIHAVDGIAAAQAYLADLEAKAVVALTLFGPKAEVLREAATFVGRRQR